MAKQIRPDDLVIHFLNVGFGDNIIVEFPADDNGNRKYGIVDCKDGDSGFRHNSQTYKEILLTVINKGIRMVRVSSGMEWYFHRVRVTALSPSVALRNRYATYGVDMNNASIVLRIENNVEDVLLTQSKEYTTDVSYEAEREAGRSVIILTGDAEFDSWSHIWQEYPRVERTSTHNPLVKKMVNYLSTAVIKVAHHGSMHSTPLDVYEKMRPSLAIISTKQEPSTKKLENAAFTEIKRGLFPHQSATTALEESDIRIITTDGSYEEQVLDDGNKKDVENKNPGSIVVVIPPNGSARWKKLTDTAATMATPPTTI